MICDNCLHKEVCGCEGAFDSALTYCKDFTGWIPVGEKLPKFNEEVLTYRPDMAMKMLVDRYLGYYGEDDEEWYQGWASGKDKVIAWMPLPQPLQGRK